MLLENINEQHQQLFIYNVFYDGIEACKKKTKFSASFKLAK